MIDTRLGKEPHILGPDRDDGSGLRTGLRKHSGATGAVYVILAIAWLLVPAVWMIARGCRPIALPTTPELREVAR